jgi:hypothetical protein
MKINGKSNRTKVDDFNGLFLMGSPGRGKGWVTLVKALYR